MPASALLRPETLRTNRSQLRQKQSSILRKAKGRTVIFVTARDEEDEKCVLDKKYFEELLAKFRAAVETLAITADVRLFNQLLKAGDTIDQDIRSGKLHSFEEAFREK